MKIECGEYEPRPNENKQTIALKIEVAKFSVEEMWSAKKPNHRNRREYATNLSLYSMHIFWKQSPTVKMERSNALKLPRQECARCKNTFHTRQSTANTSLKWMKRNSAMQHMCAQYDPYLSPLPPFWSKCSLVHCFALWWQKIPGNLSVFCLPTILSTFIHFIN